MRTAARVAVAAGCALLFLAIALAATPNHAVRFTDANAQASGNVHFRVLPQSTTTGYPPPTGGPTAAGPPIPSGPPPGHPVATASAAGGGLPKTGQGGLPAMLALLGGALLTAGVTALTIGRRRRS